MAAVAPLVVITGPTGSGKSKLALELAERHNGEIICADSRTIYVGMDIGTAKPSLEDQARVPHHLLDVILPDERFTVQDFQQRARTIIQDIRNRGRVPLLVGGTGLYIDSVVLEYQFATYDPRQRQELERHEVGELQSMIKNQQLEFPENHQNKRHLITKLMAGDQMTSARSCPDENTVVVAIATDKMILENRLKARAVEMLQQGVVAETIGLAEQYGWDNAAMTSNIYPIVRQLIDGELTQEQAVERITIRDRQLAKRQTTWLKRHTFVQWGTVDETRVYLESILAMHA